VIIFMHGLFSTDIGTFDGFLDMLNDFVMSDRVVLQPVSPELATDMNSMRRQLYKSAADKIGATEDLLPVQLITSMVGWIGWPHNTLTGIDQNAEALVDFIQATFSPSGPKLIFVCHSRGGLVARAAAAKLLSSNSKWKSVISEVITFGTPHEGAALAEHNARDLAVYFMLAKAAGNPVSILDVLSYLESRTAEGIENLSPPERTTEFRPHAFLHELFMLERWLRDRGDKVPVVAIGGRVDMNNIQGWQRRTANALLDWQLGEEHDLVVELRSSLSRRVNPSIAFQADCDHFSYFANNNCNAIGVSRILHHLLNAMSAGGVPASRQ
jgi:pimeloyl-ACP methyl ester carboxylesterase